MSNQSITLNTGAGGPSLATDRVGGVDHQIVKIAHGPIDTVNQTSEATPLPIKVRVGAADVSVTNPNPSSVVANGAVVADANPLPVDILAQTGGNVSVNLAANGLGTTPVQIGSAVNSVGNSSTTPLVASATFTGSGELNIYPSVLITVLTDQDGALYAEFSPDGTNWDSSLSYAYTASIFEIHQLVKGYRYFRVRFTNTSAVGQSFFRLHVSYGSFAPLTSPRSLVISQDTDAIVTRPIDFFVELGLGKIVGAQTIHKFGKNPDIDTVSTPEHIWAPGGLYTFPTTTETLDIVSNDVNDDGSPAGTGAHTVLIEGLDASYNEISETVTLNGITTVTTATAFFRVNRARVKAAGSTGANVGTISCQNTTSAVVLFNILPGINSTQLGLYTAPANHKILIPELKLYNSRAGASSAEVGLYRRKFGEVFALEDTYNVVDSAPTIVPYKPYFELFEKEDMIFKVESVTANNTQISCGFDIIHLEL